MFRTIVASTALIIALAVALPAGAVSAAPAERGQKSSYIVTVADGANARGIARAVQANPNFVYTDVLDGFAAQLNAGQLLALRTNPAVDAIERDLEASTTAKPAKNTDKGGGNDKGGKGGGKPTKEEPVTEEPVTDEPVADEPTSEEPVTQEPVTEEPVAEEPVVQEPVPQQTTQVVSSGLWGLDRVDQRLLPLDSLYTYAATGKAVTAYVIDTGITTAHPDFEGRASNVFDAFGGNGQDCNGHGTHVAGTIGGRTYGVAKEIDLAGLRVLDCNGSGSYSGVIAALDWVAANSAGPAVANLSFSGSYSAAMNTAVTNLSDSGVTVVAAAGNSNVDATTVSPASTPAALTVAASNRNDDKASFSNHGSPVDVYAPGVSITSTSLDGGVATLSGTSMAAPHAAGVAALYKARYGDAPSELVHAWIVDSASVDVVKGNPSGTANRLLFTNGL